MCWDNVFGLIMNSKNKFRINLLGVTQELDLNLQILYDPR